MIDSILFPQPLQTPTKQSPSKTTPGSKVGGESPFSKVLEAKQAPQEVKLSLHAQERLRSRGISLSDADMKKLAGAVDSVAQKGGKESLVMLGDAAFVVSVKNRTVVTAMDKATMQGNVFTNIDSAVFY